MYITTTGLVLRETMYKESSKILTVLTADEGKITVSAKGARRRGSKTAAATQFLAYSEMTLFNSRGRWILNDARSIEQFAGLREDLELLSLGAYFAEVLETLADEDSPNPEMLSIGLNALFALSENKKNKLVVKAAFEMRMLCLAGFEPMLDFCQICGKTEVEEPCLSLSGGVLHCRKCALEGIAETSVPLSLGALAALRHIARAEPKKIFSFQIGEATLKNLSEVCERYGQVQLDKNFKTLDFYKSIKDTCSDV